MILRHRGSDLENESVYEVHLQLKFKLFAILCLIFLLEQNAPEILDCKALRRKAILPDLTVSRKLFGLGRGVQFLVFAEIDRSIS